MLNVLRDNLKGPVLRWVLGLVAISLVLYLGSYFFRDSARSGATGDWAARVDGEPITSAKFFASAQRMEEYYRQLMGERFDQLKPQLRLGSQAIQSLVDERIQIHEAKTLGLLASPDEIAHYIQSDPNLKDPATGQFIGKEKYTQAVERNWRGGIADYENTIGDMLTVRKWGELATEAVGATDAEVEELYRSRAEQTKIDYVLVPSAGRKIETAVSDAETAARYRSHQDEYRRGEARKVRFAVVERQAMLPKIEVTDEEIAAYYQANQAQFSNPTGPAPLEQVKEVVRHQVRLQKAQERATSEAQRIRATISSAADLDAVAAREGLQVEERVIARDDRPGDLGASPQFTEAVFSTAPGAVSDPVGLARGMAILTTVGDPLPPGVRPLAEVQDRVRSDILNDRTREAARKAAADALAKGKTLEEAAKALALDLKKDQALQPGQPIPGSGGKSPELDRAIFGSGVTKGDQGVAPVPAGAVLYEVTLVEHFDAAAFQARKAALREELVSQKKSAMLQALMDRLRQKHQIEINQELVDSLAR